MVDARKICIGFDVGKAAHQACAACRTTGEVLFNETLDNRGVPIDEVSGRVGVKALVIVDQKRNIGALVLERARSAGMGTVYLPGAVHEARPRHVPWNHQDRRDRRRGYRPHCRRNAMDPRTRCRRWRVGYRNKVARIAKKGSTQSKNRLSSVFSEIDPAFEATVDLGLAWHVVALAKFGGAVGIASAGKRRYRALASEKMSVPWAKAERLWISARTRSASGRLRIAAKDEAVVMLAERQSKGSCRRSGPGILDCRGRRVPNLAHDTQRWAQDRLRPRCRSAHRSVFKP